MGLFKRGYKPVREESKRQEEYKENAGKKLFRFFISSKDKSQEAEVVFLTEEPINFHEHGIQTYVNGKERYDNKMCPGEDCTYCEKGDRPSFKGAFLIYDKRPYEYKDKDNKTKKGKGQLRLYVQGTKVLSQLDRLSNKYGITNRSYTIARTGSGTTTTYSFDRGEKDGGMSEEEIRNILPDKLKEMYDGSVESLYSIVEDQLAMGLEDYSGNDADDDDDEEEEDGGSKNLVNYDDDDDDDDDRPSRKGHSLKSSKPSLKGSKNTSPVKKPMFKSSKQKENSAKKLFRK